MTKLQKAEAKLDRLKKEIEAELLSRDGGDTADLFEAVFEDLPYMQFYPMDELAEMYDDPDELAEMISEGQGGDGGKFDTDAKYFTYGDDECGSIISFNERTFEWAIGGYEGESYFNEIVEQRDSCYVWEKLWELLDEYAEGAAWAAEIEWLSKQMRQLEESEYSHVDYDLRESLGIARKAFEAWGKD